MARKKRKRWIIDAVNELQVDASSQESVAVAAVMKEALERPSNYILTTEQCKALLSLIAIGKKHVVSKTMDDGKVADVAIRPSLFLRLKALETLCNDSEQSASALPVVIEIVPVASQSEAARLKHDESQSSEHDGDGFASTE